MALESKISSIVSTLQPDATYALASKFRANLDSFFTESTKLPIIILDNELPKNVEMAKNANVLKDTRLLIYVVTKDDPNNTDVQTNLIQAQMEAIADDIAFDIFRLQEIRPAGNQKYKIIPLFHIWNTDLSGVILDMNVRENVVISYTE